MTLLDSPVEVTPTVRSDAAREMTVMLGTTFALLAVSTSIGLAQHVDVRHIDDASALGQIAMYGQALYPAIGVLAARATTPKARRAPLGFRRTSPRNLALAWALGLGYVVLSALIVWALGLAGFAGENVGLMTVLGPTVLVLPYVLLALAEDVGWRGLLTTRLAQVAGPRTVVLVGGLVWSMFHWNLMLFLHGTPTNTPTVVAIAAFTVETTALGAILANMQLRWGIWPGLVLHAAGNAALYHVAGPLTRETRWTGWFAGETGIVTALLLVAVALVWWRVAPLRRTSTGGTEAG
ncbi:MAG: CPBP family intramembrane glutamic endopeptidase [Motilibacteraceae bacterium]